MVSCMGRPAMDCSHIAPPGRDRKEERKLLDVSGFECLLIST